MPAMLPEWILPGMLAGMSGLGGWVVRQFARRLDLHEAIIRRLVEAIAAGQVRHDAMMTRLTRIEEHEDAIRERIDRLLERQR